MGRFFLIDVTQLPVPIVQQHLHLDFVHAERVCIHGRVLHEELKVLKVTVVAEFDMHDVALSLRPGPLLPQIIPNSGHLFQSCFSLSKVKVLHELIPTKQVPVGLVWLLNLLENSVVLFELCN